MPIFLKKKLLKKCAKKDMKIGQLQMTTKLFRQYCDIDQDCQDLMKAAMDKLGLSARAYDRILKVSRTIADLDNSDHITVEHLSEAINYRSLDRDSWGR